MRLVRFAVLLTVLLVATDLVRGQQNSLSRTAEGLIRIAETGQLSDTVNVWGDIGTPGRYLIPRGTRVHELISYAGGPSNFRFNQNALSGSKLIVTVNISRYDSENGVEEIRNFRFRYDEAYPTELREYQVQNEEIVSLEVKRRPGFMDIVRVIGTTVSAITTTLLLIRSLE